MDDIFDDKYHRRVFIGATILIFIVLFVARYFLTPDQGVSVSLLKQTCISVVDNFTAGLFASLAVGATLYFFRKRRTNPELLKSLEAREIVPAFNESLAFATGWLFLGNRGRYLRSKVLPTLAAKQGSYTIDAILTDPSNKENCTRFADHKTFGISKDELGEWSCERVQSEIVAAIVVCAWYKRHPNLSINLYVKNSFSPIRLDSNHKETFLTVENKKEPCLQFKSGHFFNQWLLDDFSTRKSQCKHLDIQPIQSATLAEIPSAKIKEIVIQLGIESPSEDLISKTQKIIRENNDPFQ
jgi:hypothetical protein